MLVAHCRQLESLYHRAGSQETPGGPSLVQAKQTFEALLTRTCPHTGRGFRRWREAEEIQAHFGT